EVVRLIAEQESSSASTNFGNPNSSFKTVGEVRKATRFGASLQGTHFEISEEDLSDKKREREESLEDHPSKRSNVHADMVEEASQ
ncbi:hypothetical protein LINPERHAP1_LOCUS22107, partial [Linum perenne]